MKKKVKEPNEPIIDLLVWLIRWVGLVWQVVISVVLRTIVNILRSLNDFFPSYFTANLFHSYGSWYNNRLVDGALSYEGDIPHHFKVTVESTETITSYMIAIVRYENMTMKDLRSYIPSCLAYRLSILGENVQVQKIDKNHVKVVIYSGN